MPRLPGSTCGCAVSNMSRQPVGGRPTYAAVFDRIAGGSYTLWMHDAAVARGVAVTGGCITELDWRGLELPSRPLATVAVD